jgi:hypothetical protein
MMRPTRQNSLKKYVAVAAALAGLAFPAAASSYPVVGDNPGSPVERLLGLDYQKTHTNKVTTRTHVKKKNSVRTRICPSGGRRLAVAGCIIP